MDFQLLKETCRICLEEDDPRNMKHPCKCRGTIKYVHPRCLRDEVICTICNYEYQIKEEWYEKYIYEMGHTKYSMFLLLYATLFICVELLCWIGVSFTQTSIQIIHVPLYEFICYCLMNIPFFITEWLYCIHQKRGFCLVLFSQLCIGSVIFSIPINVLVFVPLICGIYVETAKYLNYGYIPNILNYDTTVVF